MHSYVKISRGKAAVWCSSNAYRLGGVDRCIFVTGEPRRAWHRCMGAWHGGLALGVLFYYFGVPVLGLPEPVTSLMGGCYMKWIFGIFNKQ